MRYSLFKPYIHVPYFCRSLIGGKNENYDIFPVLLTDDSGKDTGYDYKILNGWGNQQKLPDAKYWRFKNTGGYEYVAASCCSFSSCLRWWAMRPCRPMSAVSPNRA